jgi:hypothetical protein
MLSLLLNLGTDSGEVVEPPVTGGGHGFVITDTAPRLWWQNRPKEIPEKAAQKKVRRIAKAIERVAREQPEAAPQMRKAVLKAIEPQLRQMPGFDWEPIYQAILLALHIRRQEELRQAEAARIAEARRRDEEDVFILLMAA